MKKTAIWIIVAAALAGGVAWLYWSSNRQPTQEDLEREFDFRFAPFPADAVDVSFTWSVVHGDARRVKITPGENGAVHLSVDCRELTNRIDVACFAKTKGSDWGAPSFVCIYPMTGGK